MRKSLQWFTLPLGTPLPTVWEKLKKHIRNRGCLVQTPTWTGTEVKVCLVKDQGREQF